MYETLPHFPAAQRRGLYTGDLQTHGCTTGLGADAVSPNPSEPRYSTFDNRNALATRLFNVSDVGP